MTYSLAWTPEQKLAWLAMLGAPEINRGFCDRDGHLIKAIPQPTPLNPVNRGPWSVEPGGVNSGLNPPGQS